MTETHDSQRLAAYAVGLLPDDDLPDLNAHLTECPVCQTELEELRALDTALRETPPELFIDGPPEDTDWLLRRTLRNARREQEQERQVALQSLRRRRGLLVAAAAVIVVGVGAGAVGYAVHGPEAGTVVAAPAAPVRPGPGARTLTGLNPANGARLAVTLTPNPGWVGIDASITNLPAHERCMLVVTDHANNRFVVGSWVVPAPGEGSRDYLVNAGAAVALPDLASVTVESFDNQTLVAANA